MTGAHEKMGSGEGRYISIFPGPKDKDQVSKKAPFIKQPLLELAPLPGERAGRGISESFAILSFRRV